MITVYNDSQYMFNCPTYRWLHWYRLAEELKADTNMSSLTPRFWEIFEEKFNCIVTFDDFRRDDYRVVKIEMEEPAFTFHLLKYPV